ncbi:MAG TPA: hypothetical protein VGY56_04485 [Verrucomicrobiae bacterium]|nr:hypothetical protein [Verrucomicrobiae bacterium]
MAQSVLAPPPATPPVVPASVEEYQTNQPVQMRVFALGPVALEENQPFKFGPLVIKPNIFYQFTYGNGIQSSPGSQQNSVVQQLSPGVVLEAGPHWTLGYTPAFTFYSSDAFRNTINQSVQLQWGTTWRDWFVTASQSYAYTDNPQIETGGQTEQQTYSTLCSAVYQINEKLSVNMGLNQNFNDYGQNSSTNLTLGVVNSRSWSTMNWLNDQFWPRLSAGIGLGMGYNQQQDSPDSTFQQYQAQISWRITDKISFQLNGGLEDQEYLSGGESGTLAPIFGGSAQYQPFGQTKINVTASRTLSTSAFANQNLESTSILADFNQRLFGGLSLDLSGGFSSDSYIATAKLGVANSRNDDVYTFNACLSCPFPKRGTVSIFYQYSENSSTQSGFAPGSSAFSYASNQVGFDISYTY